MERLEVPFTTIQKAEEETVLKGGVKNSQEAFQANLEFMEWNS